MVRLTSPREGSARRMLSRARVANPKSTPALSGMRGVTMDEVLFAEERKYLDTHRGELLQQHPGKFALIKGSELGGVFDNPMAAYEAALVKYGNVPVFITPIVPEPVRADFPALRLGLISASIH